MHRDEFIAKVIEGLEKSSGKTLNAEETVAPAIFDWMVSGTDDLQALKISTLAEIFAGLDADKSGTVSLLEFVASLRNTLALHNFFNILDKDDSKTLDVEEFDQFFASIPQDKDGRVSKEHFMSFMLG